MMRRSGVAAALVVLALLVCAAAPAPGGTATGCAGGGAPRPDGGIGGTGMRPLAPTEDDSGIGGTGARPPGADEDDSGIGGTGISAGGDTGVIGTITGFASICVGALEIRYDADAVVRIDGAPAPVTALVVGQVVEVVASGSGAELEARDITVRHVVAGPVTGVDAGRGELEVIGQTVQLTGSTRFDGVGESAADVALGSAVQISGMRRADGVIVASLVSRGAGAVAQVTGPVTAARPGLVAIGATPVRIAPGAPPAVGHEVRVDGRWDGTQLVASRVEAIPPVPFGGRVARLAVEGYATSAGAGTLRLGPYRFDVPASVAGRLVTEPAGRVRVEAIVRDRRAILQGVGAAPDLPPRPEPPGGRAAGVPDGGPGAAAPRHDGHDHMAGERPGHGDPGAPPDRAPRPDAASQSGRPNGAPGRPERPAAPEVPDRPPRAERPALPERAVRPERPPRPNRPPRPGRP